MQTVIRPGWRFGRLAKSLSGRKPATGRRVTDEYSQDFGPFNGRTWLNCAHQGPLPRVAADEAREAIRWKVTPHELTRERFDNVPARLRMALAQLVGARPEEIVLGNSASYGLHLLANGIPWQHGDEVLVVANDFPADILPWLGLERRGVRVRRLHASKPLPDPDELRAAITPDTRLFCTTWVHSFSGFTADLDGLGSVCRERDVTFVVNASQGLGARPLDVRAGALDALVCAGFKWLCGPYGTGFCWIKPDLLESLQYNQSYWLAQMTETELHGDLGDVGLPDVPPTARSFDVFGTANFFNFKPWAASVEYLIGRGIDHIARHDQELVQHLITGLDPRRYEVLSPVTGNARSTLVFVSHRDPARNDEVEARLSAASVDVAKRMGSLRFSPHLYNTAHDIETALAALNAT